MDTNETPAQTTFNIPECNLDELKGRIEKLAKRAIKLKLTPPVLVVESHIDHPLVSNAGCIGQKPFYIHPSKVDLSKHTVHQEYRRYFTVRLVGEAPVLTGYTLVGVIEHGSTEVGNVIRVAPGQTMPAAYRTAGPTCQHCNSVRRRQETFVLLTPEGGYKQIGRNCLADFCRDATAAEGLCYMAELLSSALGMCEGAEDEDFFGCSFRSVPRAGVENVLAITARIIRHAGWMSRGQARKIAEEEYRNVTATADTIQEIFFYPKFFEASSSDSLETIKLRAAARDVQAQDVELAAKAIEWVRAMRPQVENLEDYLYNLLVVLSEETIQRKHFGIACSAISSYLRTMERQVEEKERAVGRAASQHFGTVKERGTFQLTMTGVNSFDSDFGVCHMYRFKDQAGNIAIWKTNGGYGFEQGKAYIIVATVKDHGDYKGAKQTVLTRCDVYGLEEQGTCPNCSGRVLPCHRGRNCPSCKKRGLKVADTWFAASAVEPMGEKVVS